MKQFFQRNKRKFRALEYKITFLELALEAYISNPKYNYSEEIGFNGQKIRKNIFTSLVRTIPFDAIIETGTFTGNTTGYMSTVTSLPVYTCESNRVLHAVAKSRLKAFSNIYYYLMDSRTFLGTLANSCFDINVPYIYLDAHGYDDLPLYKEIEIICSYWNEFLIMIDDFQVPGDTGYGYDTYADNQALSIKKFLSLFEKSELAIFFPSASSGEDSGAKRGCVILTRNTSSITDQVSKCNLLRQYYS